MFAEDWDKNESENHLNLREKHVIAVQIMNER